MGTLKPQSNGPLYSNTVIGTQDQDQDQFLLVWDRSCHKTEVSDHITEH